MKKILLTSFICLFCLPWVLAQQRSVSGKVTSAEDGSELPGVNVVLKESITGTSSRIVIRGNSSLTGNNQPLFVIDGILVELLVTMETSW